MLIGIAIGIFICFFIGGIIGMTIITIYVLRDKDPDIEDSKQYKDEPSEDFKKLYFDLLWCVGSKYHEETRHDTAKRYILERENGGPLGRPPSAAPPYGFLQYSSTIMNEAIVTKYVVWPGYVTSRSDGDRHYISASQLMCLYDVHSSECIIVHGPEDYYKLRGINRALINLVPRPDGNYKSYNQATPKRYRVSKGGDGEIGK